MANNKALGGFQKPVMRTGGEPRTVMLPVTSGYKTDYHPGQLVKTLATGKVEHLRQATTDLVRGVVAGYLKAPNSQSVANSDLGVPVITDLINTEWEWQLSCVADSTMVGNVVDPVDTAHLVLVNSTCRASRLYGGTPSATGASPYKLFRVLGFIVDGINDPTLANPRVRGVFNPNRLESFKTSGV